MATKDQSAFITDLILAKFSTFADFKKWLATTGIVRTNGQIFKKGVNLPTIMNRITTAQGTAIINAMQELPDLNYKAAYDQEQVNEVATLMDEIKKEIESWTFIS